MDAAATKSIIEIDNAARALHAAAPYKFHNDESVALRKFFHEPRQIVPNAGFVMAYGSPRDK
jgi:hypothetical protein